MLIGTLCCSWRTALLQCSMFFLQPRGTSHLPWRTAKGFSGLSELNTDPSRSARAYTKGTNALFGEHELCDCTGHTDNRHYLGDGFSGLCHGGREYGMGCTATVLLQWRCSCRERLTTSSSGIHPAVWAQYITTGLVIAAIVQPLGQMAT